MSVEPRPFTLADFLARAAEQSAKVESRRETEPATVAGPIQLRSIGLTIAFHEIYEDVGLNVVEIREELATE